MGKLPKQTLPINFLNGIDTLSDPKQLQPGKFLELENVVFDKAGLIAKRNGFGQLASLPNANSKYLTTYNGNLTAIGDTLSAYSSGSDSWVNKGIIQPCDADSLSIYRSATNQTQVDSVTASNGLVCTVFTDSIPVSGTPTNFYKYVVSDATTGQNILPAAVIPVASGAITGSPRVYLLGPNFVIVISVLIASTNHLQYVAISTISPSAPTTSVDISAQYTPNATVNFDGIVANNSLYLAWNGSDIGNAIRITYIDSTLAQHNTVVYTGNGASLMSVCADLTSPTPNIWVTWYLLGTTTAKTLAVDAQLNAILSPTTLFSSGTIKNITSVAENSLLTVYFETSNAYSYDSGIPSNFISKRTCTTAGVVTSAVVVSRSVGIASKAFLLDEGSTAQYLFAVYQSPNQTTYFLLNGSGNVLASLAYGNGGGYLTAGIPAVSVDGTQAQVSILFKDFVATVNKNTNVTSGTQINSIYNQTGINLSTVDLAFSGIVSSEISNNLHINGGFMWLYDGQSPVEHGFFLYPDSVKVTTSGSGGSITAQTYFYQIVYEWTDGAGNIHRSGPSVPVGVTTTGSTSTNTVSFPTLRLSYKASQVKLVVYRWSTGLQNYRRITSVSNPILNTPGSDAYVYTDTAADSSISGNEFIYTNGGVFENIPTPPVKSMTLFKSRLFFINAENRNELWYSKLILPTVPAEFSDGFQIFVAPTIGAQGSTGPLAALASLDDKLILFKQDAIYYIQGQGPAATGANNDFSEPIFVTSTVGTINQNSIVFIPKGLVFQSDKGLWLLDRNLGTSFIGAPVDGFNDALVESALTIPGTNQVRFTLDSGVTLTYDYYYDLWNTPIGIPAVSSTLFQGLHTFINQYGDVFKETPGQYKDGSNPTLISFTTGWMNLAGLQGYERAYFFYLIGSYISPHRLTIQIAYDYNDSPSQSFIIDPTNYAPVYGGDSIYGGSPAYGGPVPLEQWKIYFEQQKCQAFRITLLESYDSSFGVAPGAGLTISGLNIVYGGKKPYYPNLPYGNQGGGQGG